MAMRIIRILISLILLICMLTACESQAGTTDQQVNFPLSEHSQEIVPASSSSPAPDTIGQQRNDAADADILEGTWSCVGMYYEDELILFSEVPELANLYDQTLEFDIDGGYCIYDVPYGSKGKWIELDQQAFADFEHAYLLSKQYDTISKLENGSLTITENESAGSAIVCVQDNRQSYLVFLESDDEDMNILVYKKEKASLSGSKNSDDKQESSTDYSHYAAGTLGEQNALEKALSYLNSSAFSYEGLVSQLEFEGFSHSEAVYGADHCGADWKAQALRKAESYLRSSSFSESGLINQLEFEGFTSAEAEYGAANCGADWNEQAAKKAASYLSHSSFSRSDLIDQLEFEGFTYSQAVYGAEQCGY